MALFSEMMDDAAAKDREIARLNAEIGKLRACDIVRACDAAVKIISGDGEHVQKGGAK